MVNVGEKYTINGSYMGYRCVFFPPGYEFPGAKLDYFHAFMVVEAVLKIHRPTQSRLIPLLSRVIYAFF